MTKTFDNAGGDNGNGEGASSVNGDTNDSNNSGNDRNVSGTNGSETSGNNDASGNGANAGNGNGNESANNAGAEGSAQYWKDGTLYDATKAAALVDSLRAQIRELEKRVEKAEKASNNEGENTGEGEAGEQGTKQPVTNDGFTRGEIMVMRNEFREFATNVAGMRPDAVQLAFNQVRGNVQVNDDGEITNLASLVENLKRDTPFMFTANTTQGQRQHGSANGGSGNSGGSGTVLTAEEDLARRAFGKSVEEWLAIKEKQGR